MTIILIISTFLLAEASALYICEYLWREGYLDTSAKVMGAGYGLTILALVLWIIGVTWAMS